MESSAGAQIPPVAMQVGGIGWAVVVKTIGQLDMCALVGGGVITERHKKKRKRNKQKKPKQTHNGVKLLK